MELNHALEERIGRPEMFFGRNEELKYFTQWIENIPKKLSKSTAILSRRKKGKTALAERLFNITYSKNSNIIPFYYEVMEKKYTIGEYANDFYKSFITKYAGFKIRNTYLVNSIMSYEKLEKILKENNLNDILEDVIDMKRILISEKNADEALKYALSAPHRIASMTGEYIVQIIDEFQFLNSNIYDENMEKQVDIAGIYMSLAESKIAPVLATGSWVGWLRTILRSVVPARFKEVELGNFTEEEGRGAVLNYGRIVGVEVTEETASIIAKLCENDPYYISAVVMSDYKEKNLTTTKGIVDTIEYEVTKGSIYGTWMEYILSTFGAVNNINAKKIVLFLANNRDKEWTRKEIIENCKLDMTEAECEEKLQMLVKGDLIKEGLMSSFYSGLKDGILARVLRAKYSYEIDNIKTALEEDKNKDLKTIEEMRKAISKVTGEYNYHKGHAVEYYILLELKKVKNLNAIELENKVENYQETAAFKPYKILETKYFIKLNNGSNAEIDIYGETEDKELLIMECKNLSKKTGVKPVESFIEKIESLKGKGFNEINSIFYSKVGFTKEAEILMKKNNIMWTNENKWSMKS